MTKSKSTPVRHNYECAQSPIASVKRPRSSLERNSDNTENVITNNGSVSPGPSLPPVAMSPMHPPRPVLSREDDETDNSSNNDSASWVGRKVDALFSPVLSFLSAAKDEDVAAVTDEDATMEDPMNTAETENSSGSSSNNNSPKNSSNMSNINNNNSNVMTNESGVNDDDVSHPTTPTIVLKDTSSDEDYEDDHMRNLEEDPSSSFEEEEFNPFLFIKSLPPYEMVKHTRPPFALSPKQDDAHRVSLVLDLDETLVHCTVEPTADADLRFPVVFHGVTYQVHVRLRPHLFTFLEKIKDKFEIILFTASQKVYADELLNLIDPERKYFHHRLFRESCLSVEGNYLKDLNVLQRDLSRTVLVDNSPHAFGYQVDNGIPIESWFDDPNDTELLKLERFLRTLHDVDDVRTAVRCRFQTYQLVEEA